MAEEEKEEKQEEEKAEKKDGFFSKMKKKVNSASLESNLESTFNKANRPYYIYSGSGLFDGKEIHGTLDKESNTLLAYGTIDASYSSILTDEETRHFYYITKTDHSENITVTIKLTEDGKTTEYVRQATLIYLDPDVKKVEVIKVKDDYFLRLPDQD